MRLILYLIASVILISIVRSIIGILSKGIATAFKETNAQSRTPPLAPELGSDLHRDPVCGTFVAESTPFQRRSTGQVFYYCSNACKEKHVLAAK
jgi:hypothetical protein